MKKSYVIQNQKTREFFTNNYKYWWSVDINDAYLFDDNSSIESALRGAENDYSKPLKDVNFLTILTVYNLHK
jgi:hypothetical protein